MALARKHQQLCLSLAVVSIFMFCLTLIPPKSGQEVKGKSALGSRPPTCVNKCMGCNPCVATLVIPPCHHQHQSSLDRGQDDSYYLLAWKCRCGNNFYQP